MLLDTSGLLTLLDGREPFHQKAMDEYARAATRVTHGYVVAELVALAGVRGLPSGVVLPFVMDLMANPDIETIWPDQTLTAHAITLLLAPRTTIFFVRRRKLHPDACSEYHRRPFY